MIDGYLSFFNRYSGQIEKENIYGERYLHWITTNPWGKISNWALVKRACFSHWYGWRMKRRSSRKMILPFISKYNIDIDEFECSPESFYSFNEFFCRTIKRTKRPIDNAVKSAVFPADGRHLGFQDISQIKGVFVKGQILKIDWLLNDDSLVKRFRDATIVISRLCPIDYHRFHFTVSGTPGDSQPINGSLSSVNPIALRRNINILAENKRVLTRLNSDYFGQVLILEVGATCVGSIINTYDPNIPIIKGDEKGYFSFGGSVVITFFEKKRIQLDDDLLKNSAEGLELYAHMGDRLGKK